MISPYRTPPQPKRGEPASREPSLAFVIVWLLILLGVLHFFKERAPSGYDGGLGTHYPGSARRHH